MRIGITGSWRERNREFWSLQSTASAFSRACSELGKAVAELGAPITVGSDAKWTADWPFVQGYLSVAKQSQTLEQFSISVVRPKGGDIPFGQLFRKHGEILKYLPSDDASWRHVRLQFISEVDVLITVGGGDGTYQAGLEIKLAKKRLIPVGAFGGASARLLSDLLKSDEPAHRKNALRKLGNPWSKVSTQHVMKALGANEPSTVLLIHGHANDRNLLQAWLRNEALAKPLVMAQQFSAGQTLPEKFEQLAASSDAAVALVTPDDLGLAVRDTPKRKNAVEQLRARQNVWVEVGWFWGRLGRERILLLVRGDVEIPSDLDGIEVHRYSRSPRERAQQIRAFLAQVSQKN